MLKLRVLTALVLLPIVLGAVFGLERELFALVAGLFFLAGGWEWSAMVERFGVAARVLWCVSLALLMALAEWFQPAWLLNALPLWWLLALLAVIGYPRHAGLWFRPALLVPTGWLLLVPAWMATVQLQDHGALGLSGPWALLFVLVWVWAADTGAYFSGRAFGRHKLAPSVSPGKTVEGLAGGVVLALLIVAAVFAGGWLSPEVVLPSLMIVAMLTVLASVLGDLFESMVKRQRGIKDSGTVLPGHGGMLDRIDSVTAALPVLIAGLNWFGLPGGAL